MTHSLFITSTAITFQASTHFTPAELYYCPKNSQWLQKLQVTITDDVIENTTLKTAFNLIKNHLKNEL